MTRCVPLLVQDCWFEALEKKSGLKQQGLVNKGEYHWIFQLARTWLRIRYFNQQIPSKKLSVGKISLLFQYTYGKQLSLFLE